MPKVKGKIQSKVNSNLANRKEPLLQNIALKLVTFIIHIFIHSCQDKFRQLVLKGIKEKLIPDVKDIQASIELSYDWGWTIVMFIENTYGKEMILQIVRECDNGNVFGILGENIKKFEKRWKEWQYKILRRISRLHEQFIKKPPCLGRTILVILYELLRGW